MKIPWTHPMSTDKSRGRFKVGDGVEWTTPFFKAKAKILGFRDDVRHLVLVRDHCGEWFANINDLK